MLSVALVNVPQSVEERYGSLKGLSPELPLLGPAFLARYIEKFGFNVDLFDHANLSMQESLEMLEGYDVVGFSAYIVNYTVAKKMAAELKLRNPAMTLVVGGPHATLFPSDFDGSGIDYLVAGEGELPMLELLRALEAKRQPASMPGLYRRDGARLIGQGKARVVESLDEIGAPDVSKYDLGMYHPPAHVRGFKVIHTLTSRGCPFKCSFCAASELMQRRIRYRGTASVIEELNGYKDMGYDSVIFYDDIFTLHKKRTYELCEAMVRSGLKFKWTCFTRTQCIDIDLCRAMKEAGCYLITFGCESSNNETLRLLRKGLTHEINMKGINSAANAGILTNSSFMIGLPGETVYDIERTIDFAAQSRLTFAVFPIFEPFKGTPIYDVCKERGSWKAIEGQANALLAEQEDVWVPDTMTREDVVRLASKAFARFYFNPQRLPRLLHHALFTMPPRRSWKFLKGGARFFIGLMQRTRSSHMTHY